MLTGRSDCGRATDRDDRRSSLLIPSEFFDNSSLHRRLSEALGEPIDSVTDFVKKFRMSGVKARQAHTVYRATCARMQDYMSHEPQEFMVREPAEMVDAITQFMDGQVAEGDVNIPWVISEGIKTSKQYLVRFGDLLQLEADRAMAAAQAGTLEEDDEAADGSEGEDEAVDEEDLED